MIYTYPFTDTVVQSETVTRIRRIDDIYLCNVNPPYVPCFDVFPCEGQIYPYRPGDVFSFSLNFTPDTVGIYDFLGNLIGFYPAWINGNIIQVNPADLPANTTCFYVRVFQGENIFCFEAGFQRDFSEGKHCGIQTLTFESFYDTVDCQGNVYTDLNGNPTGFSNLRRLKADLTYIQNIEEATVVNGARTKSKIYNVYQINILQPLQPDSNLLSFFSEVVLRGRDLTITTSTGYPVVQIICEPFTDVLDRSYDLEAWYPIFQVRVLVCDSGGDCG